MKSFLSLIVCSIIFPSLVFAARPLSVDDAGTVEKGSFEIEYGLEYVNGFDNEIAMGLVITGGLFDRLDLGLEIPYVFIDAQQADDSNGISDLSVCTKLNLLSDKEAFPDISLAFAYKSDSGDDNKGLGTGKPEYSLSSIFSKSFDPLTLHFNLGYCFREDFSAEDNEDALTYGLAFEYPLNDKLTLVGEISGETVLRRKFHDNSCSSLWGLNYALTDSVTVDFGVGTEISRADPDFTVTAGITIAL